MTKRCLLTKEICYLPSWSMWHKLNSLERFTHGRAYKKIIHEFPRISRTRNNLNPVSFVYKYYEIHLTIIYNSVKLGSQKLDRRLTRQTRYNIAANPCPVDVDRMMRMRVDPQFLLSESWESPTLMLVNVYDAGSTSKLHWLNESSWLGTCWWSHAVQDIIIY